MLSYKRYAITRSETAVTNGEVVVIDVDIGDIVGSVQPVGYRESTTLPDNMRTDARYKLYTRSENVTVNGVISDGTIAIGDNVLTPFGSLRVIGNEAHLRAIVDSVLLPVAHCKYYLAGVAGG